jgi:SIR2-like protein
MNQEMAITDTSDTIRACQELLSHGKLIPFIGSGLSARFGFPTWGGLVDIIAEELGWDPEVFRLSGNFLQLAEYYVVTKGSIGPLRSKLDKLFAASEDKIAGSRAHEKLIELNFPIIYTTNYEDVIERAFRIHGPKYKKKCKAISNIDDLMSLAADETQVVKFHGTFDSDESLVITETNYFDRLEFESPLDIKLRADMLGRSLLFIGYSFSDINVRLMLYKLNKLLEYQKVPSLSPTAIMTSFGTTEIERKLLAKWNVSIVELDPLDRVKSIDGFLGELG